MNSRSFIAVALCVSFLGLPAASSAFEIVKTLPSPWDLNSYGVTWDGEYLWVAAEDPPTNQFKVFKLDPEDGSVLFSYDQEHYSWPANSLAGIDYDPATHEMYHLVFPHGPIYVYSGMNGSPPLTEDRLLSDGWQGWSPDLTYDGTYLWVIEQPGTVHKVNPLTGAVVSSYSAPSTAPNVDGIAWDGAHLLIAHNGTKKIYQVNPETFDVIRQIDLEGTGVTANRMDWYGRYLWMAAGKDGIYKIDIYPLLTRYAPILSFHPDEQYHPIEIDGMLYEASFKSLIPPEDPLCPFPDRVHCLAIFDQPWYYLDLENAGPAHPPDNPLTRWSTWLYDNVVYGRRYDPDPDHIVLQYWFFYVYNQWENNHEGDWEMIQLILDKHTEEPICITYSQHWEGQTLKWPGSDGEAVCGEQATLDDLSIEAGTHPRVVVAEGSHASYPVGTWLDPEKTVYSIVGENISGAGMTIVPGSVYPDAPDPAKYELRYFPSPPSDGHWVYWRGRWGEYPINFVPPWEYGPESPPYVKYLSLANRWDDPIEWASKPRLTDIAFDIVLARLESAAHIHAYDKDGNHVGLIDDDQIEATIPGTYLYKPARNGDRESMIIYGTEGLIFEVRGIFEGEFDLKIGARLGGEEISVTYEDIPVTEDTTGTVHLLADNPYLLLLVDEDGDGDNDIFYEPVSEKSLPKRIEIDIKPGSYPNSINPQSRGVIPVAILSTPDFDSTTVDPVSVGFGPDAANGAHGVVHIEDAGQDGDLDMILHFRNQDTGISCGEIWAGLTGLTLEGEEIMGTDSIRCVPKRRR